MCGHGSRCRDRRIGNGRGFPPRLAQRHCGSLPAPWQRRWHHTGHARALQKSGQAWRCWTFGLVSVGKAHRPVRSGHVRLAASGGCASAIGGSSFPYAGPHRRQAFRPISPHPPLSQIRSPRKPARARRNGSSLRGSWSQSHLAKRRSASGAEDEVGFAGGGEGGQGARRLARRFLSQDRLDHGDLNIA